MEKAKIVYESYWIIKKIYEVSDNIRTRVVDQTLFEERCINRIGEYLLAHPNNINNRRYIERMIQEVASSALSRNRNELAEIFSDISEQDRDTGDVIEFDPVDVLADVESEVIKKETINLLAQDNRRKTLILEAWAMGNVNDSQISRMLAHTIGGKSESHRKFIQRFQEDCQKIMAAAI